MTIIYTATARDATLIKKVKYRDTTSIAVLNRKKIHAQKGNQIPEEAVFTKTKKSGICQHGCKFTASKLNTKSRRM